MFKLRKFWKPCFKFLTMFNECVWINDKDTLVVLDKFLADFYISNKVNFQNYFADKLIIWLVFEAIQNTHRTCFIEFKTLCVLNLVKHCCLVFWTTVYSLNLRCCYMRQFFLAASATQAWGKRSCMFLQNFRYACMQVVVWSAIWLFCKLRVLQDIS